MDEKSSGFQAKILRVAGVVQNNTYISAISQGMMSTLPILMGGAVIQIIYSLPIAPWTNFLKNIGLYQLLANVVDICNLLAIFMAFGIAKTLGEKKGVDGVQAGLISLLSFLIVTPVGTAGKNIKFIATNDLGAMGVITAILVALLATTIFTFIIKKNWIIKLPDSVPPFVSNSFKTLPPALITIVPFIAIKGIFSVTTYKSLTGFIYGLLQVPLTNVGNSLGGHLLLILVCCLLWWCGVHGTLVILPFMTAIMTAPLLENIQAVNAGGVAPHTLSLMTFFTVIQFLGGPGNLIGLVICLAFFTKSERYKAQGKLSLIPDVFNIIEPTVFGLPVVLNPILFIPFVGLPLLTTVLMYLSLKAGLFTTPVVNMQAPVIPGPIAGFLLGGGLGLGVFIIVIDILSVVVYYPFVKLMDKQELKLEANHKKSSSLEKGEN